MVTARLYDDEKLDVITYQPWYGVPPFEKVYVTEQDDELIREFVLHRLAFCIPELLHSDSVRRACALLVKSAVGYGRKIYVPRETLQFLSSELHNEVQCADSVGQFQSDVWGKPMHLFVRSPVPSEVWYVQIQYLLEQHHAPVQRIALRVLKRFLRSGLHKRIRRNGKDGRRLLYSALEHLRTEKMQLLCRHMYFDFYSQRRHIDDVIQFMLEAIERYSQRSDP